MLGKQSAKFVHRVHSTSDVVDYVAFNISMWVKFKLKTSFNIRLIFT